MDILTEEWTTALAENPGVSSVTDMDVATTAQGSVEEAYLEASPEMAIPYMIIVMLLLTVGTLGNLLIIITILTSKKLDNIGNAFIVNLAVADLLITSIADPMCIIGVTNGRAYFNDKPILCEVIACLCLTACICAFLSLGLVTFHRYMLICHPDLHARLFTRSSIGVMIASVWFLAFLFESPNFLGWGDHSFDDKNKQCIWARTASVSYTLFLTVGLMATPLGLMTAAYVCIFCRVLETKKKVFAQNGMGSQATAMKSNKWSEKIRSCRTMFAIVIAFIVCWTPYTVVVLCDLKDQLSVAVHLWTTLLAHAHSSVTCIIYAATNVTYRVAFKDTLSSWKRSSSFSQSTNVDRSPNAIQVNEAP